VRQLSAEVFGRFGDYAEMLPRAMGLERISTVVAEVDGRPVGFAMASLEDLPWGEIDLTAIAVAPPWQSRGIGRMLLGWVEQTARQLVPGPRPVSVRLTVAEDNEPARRLFDRSGYGTVPGAEGRYPGGQRSLTLRKQL